SGVIRSAQERLRAAVRSLDPARSEGHHGPDPAGPQSHRSNRPRPCNRRAAVAGFSRRVTRDVLVTGLVCIRLHSMVPQTPRLSLRPPSACGRAVGPSSASGVVAFRSHSMDDRRSESDTIPTSFISYMSEFGMSVAHGKQQMPDLAVTNVSLWS